MKDIKAFITEKVNICEKRSVNWEEKIQILTASMKNAESEEDLARLKFERQQCIGRQNEFLAIADFGNELISRYLS